MAIKRKVSAVWKGSTMEGSGSLSSSNKFFDNTPYSFKTRFENEDGKLGTNPEELLAASHAGCYAMALSLFITQARFVPEQLDAAATVEMLQNDAGVTITGITLTVKGKVPKMEESAFLELAAKAKDHCPISKALSVVSIELDATFIS